MLTAGEARRLVEQARSELVDLAKALVKVPTPNPPGQEEQAALILKAKFEAEGLKPELIQESEDRANIVVRLPGAGKAPALLYDGHLDTVGPGDESEWTDPPYSGSIKNGRLLGRGASDMKGGVAAEAMAAILAYRAGIELAGDLIIASTCGEETDNLGAYTLRNSGWLNGVAGIVIAEPSSNELLIAEKGALWVEITTFGRTSHGSAPHLGINAINKMLDLLADLRYFCPSSDKHPLLGEGTASLNVLNGGFKTNVVPDRCTAIFDIRTVPGRTHEDIITALKTELELAQTSDKDFRAEFKVVKDLPSVSTHEDNGLVRLAQTTGRELWDREPELKGISGYTDAAVLCPGTNIPFIIFGPGDMATAHQPNEYVELEKVVDATAYLLLLAAKWGN
ncbi:MAG TPA: M20 family metallopeptidase [Firmicutes bacterium]|jgi:succinyl-diaminopimelate desuccinylase|nr:M20 family metallopeptidase [Bacillota bacterium]